MPSVSSYTNVDAVKNLVPSIGSASNVTSAMLNEYVTDATNEIDARLCELYAIPFTNGVNVTSGSSVPILQSLCKRMAAFDFMTIRGMLQATEGQQKGNSLYSRLKEARDFLDKIASGVTNLVDSTGKLVPQRSDVMQVWSNTKEYNPTFHEGPAVDQIQDSTKIDDILADRDITEGVGFVIPQP